MPLGKDLPRDARPRRIGRLRGVGLIVGQRQPQLAAVRVLHHDVRPVEVHVLSKGRQKLLQGFLKGMARGKGNQHPIKGVETLPRIHKQQGWCRVALHGGLASRIEPGFPVRATSAPKAETPRPPVGKHAALGNRHARLPLPD